MPASRNELRDAYVAGVMRAWDAVRKSSMKPESALPTRVAEQWARDNYPPKLVTRPREVMLDRQPYVGAPRFYRVTKDGTLQVRTANTEWRDNNEPNFFAMLRDLFVNPTETVEEDE